MLGKANLMVCLMTDYDKKLKQKDLLWVFGLNMNTVGSR